MKKREIFLGGLTIAVVLFNPLSLFIFWFIAVSISDANPKRGSAIGSVDELPRTTAEWLPPSALNISYYSTYSWQAFEFDVSEDAFLDWAAPWEIKEIDEEVTVPRFSLMDYWKREEIEDLEEREGERAKHWAVVSDGWYDIENMGEFILAYDRREGRVYYKWSPR